MKWNIVTDSACDLIPESHDNISFSSVPFIIRVGSTDYVDDESLDTLDMLDAMEKSSEASHSSCPAPGVWAKELEFTDQTIALTISSNLSGSFNSAETARNMVMEKHPNKKITVLDSCSTGPEMAMCVNKIIELINKGMDYDEVVSGAQRCLDDTHTVFVLSCFDNLIKNGRMTKIMGFIAHKLGMRGIGIGSDDGKISIKGKVRGAANALGAILEDMHERKFAGGSVIISHCHNLKLADRLREMIHDIWHTASITILPTRGLDSYYAERGGLIVAY